MAATAWTSASGPTAPTGPSHRVRAHRRRRDLPLRQWGQAGHPRRRLDELRSCPVRYEGETGWVETGDSGDIFASSPALLAGRGAKQGGYPADSHIRDFFNCVKTRGLPKANHFVACNTHIACHAAGISLFLKRKVTLDPVKIEFVGDEEANRLRTEAIREPWRI